jgi:uncharacterized protein YdhG (YjbR/CyaY superfamily)
MAMKMMKYSNIDEYIANFPAEVQLILKKLRSEISKVAPGATEKISYGIPTFYLNGNLVHFAGYENHIGFYPGAAGIEGFRDKLSAYEVSKGTVRFPIGKPIPYALISSIVKFRVRQNLEKSKTKVKST